MIPATFNLEKSIQAILYIANSLKRRDFHKIFKILYFADREHLSLYGRAITDDCYFAMEDGPVPSKIYDIFKIVRGGSIFEDKRELFSSYFTVQDWMILVPLKEADLDYLSQSDVEVLTSAIQKYGEMSWDEIREKSHDYAWHNTPLNRPISIENILLENGEKQDYIDYIVNDCRLQASY